MRRKLVLGVGLAALVGGSAAGQFAADRVPPVAAPKAAPLPGGLQPVTPPAPVLGGFQPLTPPAAPVPSFSALPVNVEIPTALGKDHPWLLKPEHGPYFILVKSYVRPAAGSKAALEDKGLSARELAEGLEIGRAHV